MKKNVVPLFKSAASVPERPPESDASGLLETLLDQLEVIPFDPALVARFLPGQGVDEVAHAMHHLVDTLVADRVVIGSQWHLVRGSQRRARPSATVPSNPASKPPASSAEAAAEDLEQIHRAQVTLDVARERLLVIRILGVLASLGGLMMGREILMLWLTL